jgi:MEMO1 family protein
MANVKIPNVAGLFYPDDAQGLRRLVAEFMAGKSSGGALPHALIAPHAGYRYSGNVAGTAYACLKVGREVVRRVIILAPHRLYFPGIAVSSAEFFETPLGMVEVDTAAMHELEALPVVKQLDEAFEEEHSLEVQLPFLQEVLDQFKIVPLLVGPTEAQAVCEVIERLKRDQRSIVVASSDLSHYLSAAQARALDAQTSDMIEKLALEELEGKRACGAEGIKGLLCYARKHGLKAKTVHLTNSGEETGDLFRVVGYGAYIFTEA